MKTKILTATLLFLIFTAPAAFADYDVLIKKIDKAWAQRGADSSNMKDALSLAEQAYGEKPGFEAAYRAAMCCFWICDRTENEDIDLQYGKRGVEWAEKAIAADPNRVEGHYFYTVCLGEYGKGLSIVTALAKGLGKKFEESAAKAIRLDGTYDHGAPFRALGRYYYSIPWPKYDFAKAEQNYLASLKVAPKQARTYVYLAELYIKEKNYDKARETLKKLDEMDAGYADSPFEYNYFKKAGKDLEAQIQGK